MSETIEEYMSRMMEQKKAYERSLENLPMIPCERCGKETPHKEHSVVKHGAATAYDKCVVCENMVRRQEGLQPISHRQVFSMRQQAYREERKVRDE